MNMNISIFDDIQQRSPRTRYNVTEQSLSGKEIDASKQFLTDKSTNNKRTHESIDDYISPNKKAFINDDLKQLKQPTKQSNQKEAAQRYRQNLKEKSKKVETELQREEDKNSRLKRILNELETALGSLSKSLTKQTKIESVDNLLDALKTNGLTYTAEKVAEVMPVVKAVAQISPSTQSSVSPTEHKVFVDNSSMEVFTPVVASQQPLMKQISVVYDDDDCLVNNFQELFMNEDELQRLAFDRSNSVAINSYIEENISTMDINFPIDFSLLEQL